MSEKRKDSKGRLLRTGETQRPNGTYAYRYIDLNNKRQTIYAKTLDQLGAVDKPHQIFRLTDRRLTI